MRSFRDKFRKKGGAQLFKRSGIIIYSECFTDAIKLIFTGVRLVYSWCKNDPVLSRITSGPS